MEKLHLGVAREVITPPVGGPLYGYQPDWLSEALEDDLTVTAFCFRQGSCGAMMLSATVCLIRTELANQILDGVSEKTGIPRENILLSATHTHSGPNTAGAFGWGDLDREYCREIFVPRILAAAEKAAAELREVTMYAAVGESLVGINRRQLSRTTNQAVLGQNPWGPFNPRMTVLSFRDEKGKTLANLIHYGCHGTAAGKNREITRDWSGLMTDALEAETGGITAFFNGPEGDVGPRISNGKTTGDLTYVRELGAIAAEDALRIHRLAVPRTADLKAGTFAAAVPLEPRMPEEEAREQLKLYKGNTVNKKAQICRQLETILAAYEKGEPEQTHFTFPQTVIHLGDFVFASFPFELFSEIGMRIDGFFEDKRILSLSNTNGSEGYFVTEDAFCRGGYEVDMHLYGHIQTYKRDADYSLVLTTVENIKKEC